MKLWIRNQRKGCVYMRIVAKKVIIYSMLGLLQVGMLSSVASAAPSPFGNNGLQQIVELRSHGHYDNDRQRDHDERMRRERERHEREMRRRHYESEREWRERQRRENERHDHELHEIAALLIGIVIGSGSNND